jgi:pSer/pThr/pTyr-binding forkhead associated (FHA) protein
MLTLDELEFRLQTLLEVNLLKYLPGYRPEDRVYQQLAAVMHQNLIEQDGKTYAPDMYVVMAQPDTIIRWQAEPRLMNQLAEALHTAGNEAGFYFFTTPTVTTSTNLELTAKEIRIIASFRSQSIAETRGMTIEPREGNLKEETLLSDAFLILAGEKVIPLDRPVINLGRRLENQIVLDDPRVSRNHAQIRFTKGGYYLFDLNSSGGTFINGHRINKTILHPGDVISLAGVTLVFSHDLPSEHSVERISTEPNTILSANSQDATSFQFEKEDKKKTGKP